MDFIGELPPELVYYILLLVSVEDVLACMLVCRLWYGRIYDLGEYWRTTATTLGVAGQLGTKYGSYREVTVAMHRSMRYLSSSEPKVKYLTDSCPPDKYFQYNYARFGVLVGTLYSNFSPNYTTVEKLQPLPGTCILRRTHELDPVSSNAQHRVAWAHLYCDYLVLVTASGHWRGVNLVTNKIVLEWLGPSFFDTNIMFSCCDHCNMVAVVQLVSQRRPRESYWGVHLIRLGRGDTVPIHVHYRLDTPFLIPPLQAGYGCKKIALLSKSAKRDREQFCLRHWLAIQWADTVFGYEVVPPAKIVSKPLFTFTTDSVSIECMSSEKLRNTDFVLSLDLQLIGLVFHDKLHVWNLQTLTKQVTKSCIVRSSTTADDGKVCLVALGHIYSLIGFESVQGKVQVISTYSGQVLFSTFGFSGLETVGHNIRGTSIIPPYFTFLGAVDEQWLNNMDRYPQSSMPVVLFWDKYHHCTAGIVFDHTPHSLSAIVPSGGHDSASEPKSTQRKGWRKMINLLY